MDEKYSNKTITELLRNVAAAFLIKDDPTNKSKKNLFRRIAFEKAADSVEHLSREIRDMWQEGKLYKVPGIGPGIGGGLEQYFETGESADFNEMLHDIPKSVFVLMKAPGIGPKKAFRIVKEFGLVDEKTIVEDVKKVANAHKIAELEGFGEKSEKDILEALELYERQDRREERMPLPYAHALAIEVIAYLKELKEVKQADSLGSMRRAVPTIGDIDIAVVADEEDGPKIVEHFLKYPGKRSVEGSGPQKASILAANNIRIDLRVQDAKSYGSMLQYFTGSKAHNIKLREFALKKHLSLSEYGIKKLKPGEVTKGPGKVHPKEGDLEIFAHEKGFYEYLGLPYIPPEIREGTTEIDVALKGKLPNLVELKDIKGDFHMHSSYDLKPSHDMGKNTYQELAANAKRLGYDYVGFTDHNPKSSGLSTKEIIDIMKVRKAHIDKVCSSAGIDYFIGLEVDILPSGELALPEEAIEYLDFMIVSLHSQFRQEASEMTERILKAFCYPKVKIFGHPTGRLLGKREGADINWEPIFKTAAERNIALEINSSPDRLDLPETLVREGLEYGVKFTIDTDAHAVDQMDLMQYGVMVARRGWVEPKNVINTMTPKQVREWMKS
ncbi:MAG: PHP domain-containing protein [Weeksellaceae bacterium]